MSLLKKTAIVLGALAGGLLLLVGAVLVWWNIDAGDSRYPDYRHDVAFSIDAGVGGQFVAGAAMNSITPALADRLEDVNGNGRYDEDVDRYSDDNHNGRFDPVWLAGYDQNRPATGVNDTLSARAVVFGYPGRRVAICAVDLVGLFYEDVIAIRQTVNEVLAASSDTLAHVIVASTHVHSGPDVIGLWGPGSMTSGVDPAYLARVRETVARTIIAAARSIEPAEVAFAAGPTGVEGFVRDTRDPQVVDDTLAVARFVRARTGETIATLVNWHNHPEVLADDNTKLTADFPHWLREGVERGLPASKAGDLPHTGAGGVCVYLSGAVGGLMTPLGVPVPERYETVDTTYTAATFPKARALGRNVAARVLALLDGMSERHAAPLLEVRSRTIFFPLENRLFRMAVKLGVIDRGFVDGQVRTEVNVMRLGPSAWTCVPGEVYPEIMIGGVEAPEGRDFPIAPVEMPPVKALMPGAPKFVLGLANDEIGYIIPRSQWDADEPFAYGRTKRPYGEVNSIGPEAGPAVHGAIRALWTGREAVASRSGD